MTGFILHCCKKIKQIFQALLIILLVTGQLNAQENSYIKLTNANFIEDNQQYTLTAEADVAFSDAVQAALKKGFKLNFVLEFQLLTPRKYWFDDEIITQATPIVLSYHAVSRQYILSQMGQKQTFSSLASVEAAFTHLQPVPAFKQALLSSDETYHAVVLLRLDYKKLPQDLYAEDKDSGQWKLTSQRYTWAPLFFKK